jgi:hypothetical protein
MCCDGVYVTVSVVIAAPERDGHPPMVRLYHRAVLVTYSAVVGPEKKHACMRACRPPPACIAHTSPGIAAVPRHAIASRRFD